jgi:hypothetical protein
MADQERLRLLGRITDPVSPRDAGRQTACCGVASPASHPLPSQTGIDLSIPPKARAAEHHKPLSLIRAYVEVCACLGRPVSRVAGCIAAHATHPNRAPQLTGHALP